MYFGRIQSRDHVREAEFSWASANVVARAQFEGRVSLSDLAARFGAEPQPRRRETVRFSLNLGADRASFFVASSGATTITGARTPEALDRIVSELNRRALDGFPHLTGVTIRNVVGVADLHKVVNLVAASFLLAKMDIDASYEPEQFPGIVTKWPRDDGGRLSLLLFSSGKVTCAGASSERAYRKALLELASIVQSL